MAKKDCFTIIREQISNKVPDDMIHGFLRDAENIRSESANSPNTYFAKRDAILKSIQEKNEYYKKVKADYLLKTKANLDHVNNPSFKGDVVEGIRSLAHGTNKALEGSRDDVARRTADLTGEAANLLKHGLDQIPGGEKIITSGIEERSIARHLWAMEDGRPAPQGVSSAAKQIGDTIAKVNQLVVGNLQRSGAYIKYRAGYIFKQTHDSIKLMDAGFDKWKASILPKLDVVRTFDKLRTPGEIDKFLKEAYHDITFGKSEKSLLDDATDVLLTTPRQGKLATRVAAARKLHFKDADSFMDYNAEFGKGTLLEGVMNSIRSNARNTALMERFGANPREGYAGLISRVKSDLKKTFMDTSISQAERDAAAKSLEHLKSNEKKLMDIFDSTAGEMTTDPGKNPVIYTMDNARRVVGMAKQGASVFSQLPDIATGAALVSSRTGGNFLGNIAKLGLGMAENIPTKHRHAVMKEMGMVIEDFVSNMAGALSIEGAAPGMVSKLERVFYKYNLQRFQAENWKATVGKFMAKDLGKVADQSFDQLSVRHQYNLKASGIDSAKWDVIRTSGLVERDGIKYIFSHNQDGSMRISDRDAGVRLMSYMNGISELATSMPQAREKYIMYGTDGADTALGQVRRMVAQFKGVPLTQLKIWSQVAHGTGENIRMGDVQNMVGFMLGTTSLGALALYMQGFARGDDPRKFLSADTFKEAFLKGGSGTMYSDYLLNLSRYGSHTSRELITDLAGPLPSEINKTFNLVGDMISVKVGKHADIKTIKHADIKTIKHVVSNVPFNNLFWTKRALDGLILENIYQGLDPQYKVKLELQKAKRRQENGY